MKWQHCPKMYSLLLSIFVIVECLLGAPVDKAVLDQLLPADAPINMHTTLSEEQTSLSITLAPMWAPSAEEQPLIKSTALTKKPGKQEFELPFQSTGKSLTTAEGLGIDDNEMNRFWQSRAMAKSTAPEERSSTSSIHLPNVVMSNLVSTEPTEVVLSNHSEKHTVNTGAQPLDLASTKPFLPVFSTIETSDEELAWHREVITPLLKFSTQPMLSSEGTPALDIPGNLQNSSALAPTHTFDEMESHTVSSESAESSTFKLTSVEQIKTRRESMLSTAASTLHTLSTEPDLTAHLKTDATSWNSGMFKELSTSSWSTNSGSPNSSEGNNWQSPDASEEVYSTAASGATNWLPDVSEEEYTTASTSVATEDVYSTASSTATNWLPDVSEEEYTTASTSVATEDVYSTASSSATNWLPDVSEEEYTTAFSSVSTDVYSTASSGPTNWLPNVSDNVYSTVSSSPTNWLPNVSEDVYSTAFSSVATEEEHSTAASSGPTNWLPDVSEDVYSTAFSSVATEEEHSTAASSGPTNWLPDVSEDVYFTAFSSVATEDVYSTAASSGPTNWLPDVSKEEYSTASSGPTNWQPDVSEEYSTSLVTNWPSSSSEAAFSRSLPRTQPTIWEEVSSTDELSSSSAEYFSTTSSTNVLPSASEALSLSTNWKLNLFEKLSTSLDSTSYRDPFTSSPANGIYLNSTVSEVQPFTMITAIGTEPEATSFTMESSKTASSHSQIGQSTSVMYNPLLLQFEILNRSYTNALSNSSSEAYQELAMVVKGTLNAIFYARYGDRFLGTKILSFVNGSVKVESEVVFQECAALPSSSDVVRTVLTHVYHKDLVPTALEINASSVVCNGYSLANLEPERILIEFTALSTGFGPWSDEATFFPELLQRLSGWVVATLEEKYLVQEFNIGRVITIQGDVNVQGTALLTTPIHIDDAEALLLLNNLVNNSVDLRSLQVNGSSVNLGVLPVSFMITNREYNTTLRDSRSAYFCSLGKAVTQALQAILKPKYSHFMQAVIKQFGSGSVISTSDLVFLSTPPSSSEVLDVFFNSVDSEGFLAGTDFTVDAYSFAVGAARLDRPYKRIHFPGFGIAIILLCGLAIISLPLLAFLCWKYRFCTACQKTFTFEAWDVERENTSVHIPLPEVNRESYRLHEAYVNYSFES